MGTTLTLGSLFSGRGGFEIGAAACGIQTLWTCEIDEFLNHKLKRIVNNDNAKHYRDVRTLQNPARVDIMSAGFPCQDISCSNRGNKKGIFGPRSGLWFQVVRIAAEIKPRHIVLENSPELLKKGFEYVLSNLSRIGYNVEWDCWRAADFGYPHNRKRLYAVAYSGSNRRKGGVLQPPGAYELHKVWTPTEAYLRLTGGRANGFRDTESIQRGDVVLNYGREIHAFGNAVMPVIAEHLFRCIIDFDGKLN